MYDLTKVVLLLVCHELYNTQSYKDLPLRCSVDGWGWNEKCIVDPQGNPFNGEIEGKSELCYPWYRYKAIVCQGQVMELHEFFK